MEIQLAPEDLRRETCPLLPTFMHPPPSNRPLLLIHGSMIWRENPVITGQLDMLPSLGTS